MRNPVWLALLGLAAPLIAEGAYPYTSAPGTYDYQSTLGYLMSLPTAGTHDFIGDASFRGLGIESYHRMPNRIGLGLSVRWVYFSDTLDNATSVIDTVTVTGIQYRSVDAIPILFEAHYDIFGDEPGIRPYFAVGIGPMYTMRQLLVGPFSGNKYGWQFDIAPEVGTYFPAFGGGGSAFTASLRYDAGFGTDDLPAVSFLSLQLGLTFGL